MKCPPPPAPSFWRGWPPWPVTQGLTGVFSPRGPAWSRPHLLALSELREHDDEGCLLLPHHLPEVRHRVGHGALGGNVGLVLPAVALQAGRQAVSMGPGAARAAGAGSGCGPTRASGTCTLGAPRWPGWALGVEHSRVPALALLRQTRPRARPASVVQVRLDRVCCVWSFGASVNGPFY